MRSHNLTIIASGLDPEATDFADRLFEAGCSDATIAVQKGLLVLEFDREARTFGAALLSALRDVERAGARIERVEPDHLVSASEIARRAGLGRAAISLYAKGARGVDFPHPVARVTTDGPLWDWVEVSAWMYREHRLSLESVLRARMVRDVNLIVSERQAGSSYFARQLHKRGAVARSRRSPDEAGQALQRDGGARFEPLVPTPGLASRAEMRVHGRDADAARRRPGARSGREHGGSE